MKRQVYTALGLAMILAWLLLSCAPAATPAPSAPAPQPAAPAAPAASPEDAAWQKVVEAAKKEGRVTLYAFSFVGDIGISLSRAFEQEFGIKVDIVTGRGAEFVERLKTEQRTGQVSGDISEGSPTHLTNMKVAGVTVDLSGLPVLREKGVWKAEPSYLDPQGHVLSYTPTYMWGWRNTRLVKDGEEPKSHMELLDPKWRGKVMINDVRVSVGSYTTWYLLVKQGLLPKDFIQRLGENKPLMVTGGGMGIEKVGRGEAPIYMAFPAFQGTRAVAEGAPIRPFDLKEGVVAQALSHVVIKNSPHPNAAKVFANWLLTKQGQTAYAQAISGDPIRKDAPQLYPEPLRLTPAKPAWSMPVDIDEAAKLMREQAWVPFFK